METGPQREGDHLHIPVRDFQNTEARLLLVEGRVA